MFRKRKFLGTRFNQGLKVVGKGNGPKSGSCLRRQLRAALNSGHAPIRGRHQILVRPHPRVLPCVMTCTCTGKNCGPLGNVEEMIFRDWRDSLRDLGRPLIHQEISDRSLRGR